MRHTAFTLLSVLILSQYFFVNGQRRVPVKPKVQSESAQTEKEEWDYLKRRFTDHWPRMSGLTWSLIHNYESKSELDRAMKLFEEIALALAVNNPATIRKFKGPLGLKEKLNRLMGSKDQTISGFAAYMLAIVGDHAYAPHIAGLLKNDAMRTPAGRESTIRGQAAGALGILGARQYIPQIALLLDSPNHYDRRGAVTALSLLKATGYADRIASLLTKNDPEAYDWDDETPITALFELGVAARYKKEIATVLRGDLFGERVTAAAYALARLSAKEYAQDIAQLLTDKFNKGEAAKALALLGAKEHIKSILPLLQDSNSFTREDGALALGILDAREHAEAIAKLLEDQESRVQHAAARALVLMEQQQYAADVIRVLGKQKEGPYFDFEDFNPIVNDQAVELDKRFMTLWDQMKRRQSAPVGLNWKRPLRHTSPARFPALARLW
jgi:HEAT repeat protein